MKLKYSIVSILLLTALVAVALWASISKATDLQMSTCDLSVRDLVYRQWFGHAIGTKPVANLKRQTQLSRYITKKGWAISPPGKEATYIAVSRTEPMGDVRNGPAKLLYSKLYGAKPDDYWTKWSLTRQEIAETFWPKILALVNAGRLDEAAMLLGFAEDPSNDDIALVHLIGQFK